MHIAEWLAQRTNNDVTCLILDRARNEMDDMLASKMDKISKARGEIFRMEMMQMAPYEMSSLFDRARTNISLGLSSSNQRARHDAVMAMARWRDCANWRIHPGGFEAHLDLYQSTDMALDELERTQQGNHQAFATWLESWIDMHNRR